MKVKKMKKDFKAYVPKKKSLKYFTHAQAKPFEIPLQ